MPRAVSRNNVIAGLFVVASMLLAIAISVAVSGVQKQLVPTEPYIIRFSILDGTAGLKPGSSVTLGGQEVGRVASVEFARSAERPVAVDVHARINRSITLYRDAWVFLERPLLGSMATINIARVGGDPVPPTGAAAPAVPPGGMLEGSIAPPSFLAQAGYGPDQARQLRTMMAQATSLIERLDRLSSDFEGRGYKTIQGVIDDFGAVGSEFRQKVPGWTEQADSILGRIDTAAGNADQVIRDLQEAVRANRPALDRTMANIDEAVRKVNEESVPAFNEAVAKGKDGVAAFSEATGRFNALVQEQTPNLRTIMANLRLASDQVKLTMVEVRRNPWRLLYSPKTKELEAELFYDAARTYAQAVSDLRAASESLEIMTRTDGAGGSAVDRETLQHITRRLEEAFQRYKAAEEDLLKKMIEKRP